MSRKTTNNTRGISMIEVLIAIAVFTLSIATLGTMGFSGMEILQDANTRYRADLFAEEGLAALKSIRTHNPSALVPGTYCLIFSDGTWSLSPTPDTDGNLTRTITVTSLAPNRMLANVTVTWNRNGAVAASVSSSGFIDIFANPAWTETSSDDFTAGKKNGTAVLSLGDGALGLELRKDWGKPKEFVTHDVVGTGLVTAMAEAGGILYVASWGVSGTTIDAIDLSAAGAGVLTQVLSITRPERINALAVSGRYIFAGGDGDTSELIALRRGDLSVAQTINLTGTSDILSLAATGTTLYAGRTSSTNPELYEFNVANPETGIPQVRSANFTTNIAALALNTTYIFLGGTSDSAEIIAVRRSDFGTAATTNLAGTANATSLVLSGNSLYVGRNSSAQTEVTRIDVTNPPGGLTVSGGLDTTSSVTALVIGSDKRLYAATASANGELSVIEPSTFTATTINVTSGAGASAILFVGGYAYVGLQNSNPEVVSLRGGNGQWENPQIIGSYDAPSNADAYGVLISGTTAYLGTQSSSGKELSILNIANPSLPQLLGSLEIGANVNKIAAITGNVVIATSNNSAELRVVNITNPNNPVSVGVYNTPGNMDGLSVAASGTLVALGTDINNSGNELYLFNVSNPAAPVLLASQKVGGGVRGLSFTTSGYLLAATENDAKELIVYDPRVAGLPEVSSYNTTGTTDGLSVHVSETTVSFTTQNSGVNPDFYIFTLNPANGALALKGSLDLGANATDAFVNGDLTYVSTNNTSATVMILDTSNSAAPRILSSIAMNATGYGVSGDAARLYAATSDNTREFAAIGPNPPLTEYVSRGWFTSVPFDSGSASTIWGTISWSSSGTGTVAFQVRTASSEAGLSSALWVGASGLIDDYYGATNAMVTTDPLASGTEWIQLRAMLTGDSVSFPQLEDVTITYN